MLAFSAIRIDDALNQLARHDPRKAGLVGMRYFGGLAAEESAAVLALPVDVIRRGLRVAQAWLRRELNQGQGGNWGRASEGPLLSSSGRQSHD